MPAARSFHHSSGERQIGASRQSLRTAPTKPAARAEVCMLSRRVSHDAGGGCTPSRLYIANGDMSADIESPSGERACSKRRPGERLRALLGAHLRLRRIGMDVPVALGVVVASRRADRATARGGRGGRDSRSRRAPGPVRRRIFPEMDREKPAHRGSEELLARSRRSRCACPHFLPRVEVSASRYRPLAAAITCW